LGKVALGIRSMEFSMEKMGGSLVGEENTYSKDVGKVSIFEGRK